MLLLIMCLIINLRKWRRLLVVMVGRMVVLCFIVLNVMSMFFSLKVVIRGFVVVVVRGMLISGL